MALMFDLIKWFSIVIKVYLLVANSNFNQISIVSSVVAGTFI